MAKGPAALPAEIDGPAHGDRLALLARRARTAGAQDLTGLLADLGSGGRFERANALFLATAEE
jgi:hypothetical protein